jgi:hypothetical protein
MRNDLSGGSRACLSARNLPERQGRIARGEQCLRVLLSSASTDFVESDFDLERAGEYPVCGFADPIVLFADHG